MGAVARVWPDFVAVHMVWGAINELTTLAGYQRLAELEPHLLMWLAKYAAWIPDSPAHALVYLADEEDHGVPFPKGIERVIEESLGIQIRAANKALQPTAAEGFASGRG